MIKKLDELTDEQVASASVEELRNAYRDLLRHHIEETTQLWNTIKVLRKLRQP